jgi:prophage regulatory protein
MSHRLTLPNDLPATGYVRQSQLIPRILPISAATLWRLVRCGAFPAPLKLSHRVTAWRVEDVKAWMEQRAAADQRRAA